jgi:type II secretory pathway pseudopilin PulG
MARRAFSILELLVIIAIIAVLAALLFPVFSRARQAALESSELSIFRQIAVARGLYLADNDDEEPGFLERVIAAGYAPTYLAASPLDPLPQGWGNLKRIEPGTQLPYKYSFFSLGDGTGQPFWKLFLEAPYGGWLISPGTNGAKYGYNVVLNRVSYRRLTFDSTVVTRVFAVGERDGSPSIYSTSYFADIDPFENHPSRKQDQQ